MTLCKYRPRRTYDAQFIIEEHDTLGLMKMLEAEADVRRRDGEASTLYYDGARAAFSALFDWARQTGEVDTWMDFMALFGQKAEEMEGGER